MAAVETATPDIQGTRQNARWLGRREVLAMIVGIILYAVVIWFSSFAQLDSGLGIALRPGIVIPIIFGFVYGPVVGFAVGTIGNTLTDYWQWNDIWWQWSVGNGIMGLIPGLYALRWRAYYSPRDQIMAFIVTVIGIIAGIGFASFSSILICQEGIAPPQCFQVPITFEMAFDTFRSATEVNIISAIILVPLLLFNVARLDLSSMNWMSSGLLRRLLLAVVISAALPIALLGFFLIQQISGSESNTMMVQVAGTVVVTLLFTLANASLVAQTLNRPLVRLTEAAKLMEAGELDHQQMEVLEQIQGDDEISNLSRIFGSMAQQVARREAHLRKQVEELKIQIDDDKKQQAVEDITETEFFRDLKDKSRDLRKRRQNAQMSSAD